ncbi:MAG: response regulator transcription factor [Alistipes sp.]|nr:response regulator transcription factor [Alistipes sp.]
MKVLIVEDDASLREIMLRALKQEGYVVEYASTFSEADIKLAGYNYDCILLDIMLPDGSGLDLLEHLRKLGKRENVIIISARNSLEDKIYGLENGADDYLAKPFHVAELIARVRSVLRRGKTAGELTLEKGNVVLTPESRHVKVDGCELALLKKEFDILLYFMQRPGHMVDKAVLAEAVWGDYADDADNFQFVYAQIKNLRRKLSEAGATIEITSVYGFGYKLVIKQDAA